MKPPCGVLLHDESQLTGTSRNGLPPGRLSGALEVALGMVTGQAGSRHCGHVHAGTGQPSVGAGRDGRRRQADRKSNPRSTPGSDTGMKTRTPVPCPIVVMSAIFAALPTPTLAQDGARISRLESEIQQLRTQVDEQNRRIRKLEADLARRSGTAPANPASRRPAGEEPDNQPAPAGPQAWHAAAAWDRVAKGMTADEVTAILGAPTAAESVDALRTLFYRGSTPAGGSLSGMVNLRDDRVVAVVKPAF